MAYQLWTSPITGYRRKGTRLSDVSSLFENGITVKAIFEPLKSCPAHEGVIPIKEVMRLRDFDVLGVMENESGPVIGYVLQSELKNGKIEDHLKRITAELLVSDSASVVELFKLFLKNDFLFVLNKTKVEGIITKADLNKPALRIYLFSLISLLEMHMSFWVRISYLYDSWKEKITSSRLKKAEQILKKRKEQNEAIDLFECLQFCDKRDLFLKIDELSKDLSIKSDSKKKFEIAEQLRNSLAHSQLDLSNGIGWANVFETVQWIDNFLLKSDQVIENKAKEAANRYNDNLL